MLQPRRSTILLYLVLALSAPAAAAADQNVAEGKAKDSAERLKEESNEALDALADYSAEQKTEASATAEDLVARLDKRIELLREDLKANWDQMSEATRTKREAAIDELAEQRDKLQKQFQELSERSGKAWQELKDGFVRSYRALAADDDSGKDASSETGSAN